MHPTSNTKDEPHAVILTKSLKQLQERVLNHSEIGFEQDAASSLMELLQNDLKRHAGGLPSALEKLAPILDFVVAMSYFSGKSLRWTRTLSCNCPSGELKSSEPDCDNRPPDSQLPLRLLMVTAMIELRLRLPTAISTTEESSGDIEPILTSCFKLILLGISELSVLTSEDKEDLANSMSDDAVSELFLQLLDFSYLLLESIVSWNSASSTDTVAACDGDLSITVLGCLATFLRWTVFYMTNHFLSVVDDVGAFGETFFQPQNSSSDEYMAIADRFKSKCWLPVLPVIQRVIPLAFRLSAEPIFTNKSDQVREEFLIVCRQSICSLARMFPLVLLSTINFGTADIVNCLSLDFSRSLHSTSSREESSLKLLFELMDYLRDLTLLLDTGLSSVNSAEKVMSQIDQPITSPSETNGQPMSLKDACVPILGHLFFGLLGAKKQSILDAILSTRSPVETASEFGVCPSCREYDRALYCETMLATLSVLRFLTTNIWQAEMCILLHVASSSMVRLEIPDNPMHLLEDFALKLSQMDLDALQLVVGLPSELIDCSLSLPIPSPFRIPLTLRTAARALLRCCQRTCKKNAPFRRAWKAGLTARQPNIPVLFK
ncbi:unnamed protein product [Schistocephalus solidus]|uniref:Non-specific serine/threonine protein kinase n=1 Tax=Schistocephalus solidus TaxID=70667 RepID=A0A183T3K7_SCHSO|nr:unnamed protein product [Schistocephalus solidus]